MSLSPWLERIRAADIAGFHLINESLRNPLFDSLMPFVSDKWNFFAPLSLFVLYVLLFRPRRDKILAVSAVAVVLLADITNSVLKELFQRIRPCHTLAHAHLLKGAVCTNSFSFPSNHASNMFAIATVGWLALGRWRWGLLAVAVAYSRVYVGVHYPGDTLAGALWGTGLGWICICSVARSRPEWFTAEPPAGVPRAGLNPAGGAHTR